MQYWELNGNPPTKEYYRTYKECDAIWYQLYETVSEGTPVSPPFKTRQELANYLAENGDFWDQRRCLDNRLCELFGLTYNKPGWGKGIAEKFCSTGYSPSLVIKNGKVMSGVDFIAKQIIASY